MATVRITTGDPFLKLEIETEADDAASAMKDALIALARWKVSSNE